MQTLVKVPTLDDIWGSNLTVTDVAGLPDYTLRVTYADGEAYRIDFRPWIGRGGLSDALADPAYFARASVGESGDSVEWPNGYDHGADTLRLDGELARRGLTRADLVEAE